MAELQKQMKKVVADEDFEAAGAIKKQLKSRQAVVAAERNAAKNKEAIAAAGKAADPALTSKLQLLQHALDAGALSAALYEQAREEL